MLKVGASNMTHPTHQGVLQFLLDAGEASQANVKWGSGHRNVVIFHCKKYQYKGTGSFYENIIGKYFTIIYKYVSKRLKTNKKN